MESAATEQRSFRDPDGELRIPEEGPIRRYFRGEGAARARAIQDLAAVKAFQERGAFIAAQFQEDPAPHLVHPRIPFPVYAHEWSPSMLHRAARLTLDLNLALLDHDWELKDATPTNILFQGTQPVFVDYLSPVPRPPSQMGWQAYGQFARTFLIPLLLNKRAGLPLRWLFLARRDGLPPEEARRMLGFWARWAPPAAGLVSLPAMLARHADGLARLAQSQDPATARRMTRRVLQGLGATLESLRPKPADASLWSAYQDDGVSYSADAFRQKGEFVAEVLRETHPATVLDIGANTGKFSQMAAAEGASCLAVDNDLACVERIFLEAEAGGLAILPMTQDLGRPSPANGWAGREERSFEARTRGQFDLVLALAIIHHVITRERIPLEEAIGFLASRSRRWLLIEWVEPQDPQFQRLAHPYQELYQEFSFDHFAACAGRFGKIVKTHRYPDSHRTLCLVDLRPEA